MNHFLLPGTHRERADRGADPLRRPRDGPVDRRDAEARRRAARASSRRCSAARACSPSRGLSGCDPQANVEFVRGFLTRESVQRGGDEPRRQRCRARSRFFTDDRAGARAPRRQSPRAERSLLEEKSAAADASAALRRRHHVLRTRRDAMADQGARDRRLGGGAALCRATSRAIPRSRSSARRPIRTSRGRRSARFAPDMLTLDVEMPRMDGIYVPRAA